MKRKEDFLKVLPYFVAIILFFVLSASYFAPQFKGETLEMGDVTQYMGMSEDIRQHIRAEGEDPQWTGNLFGGMPSYMISMRYPSMIIYLWSGELLGFMGRPAVLIFLSLLSFWIMLSMWKVKSWVAIIPAIAYGFSTYSIIIIGAGHINKMIAFAYAPLLLGAVLYTLRSKHKLLGMLLSALFGSLLIAANHPQITYYFIIIIAALMINELVFAIKDKKLLSLGKSAAMLLLAAFLAVGSNTSSLYYALEHSPDTTRGGSELVVGGGEGSKGLDLDYATAWSYGIGESANLFIPNAKGGSSSIGFKRNGEVADALRPYNARELATQLPTYHGEQPFTSGPVYIGAVIIFLAILGLFLLKGREKWWLLGVSVFALLLSWGSNMMWFTELMFKILPGYDKFRAVSTTLVIVQWCVPVLGALALAKIWSDKYSKKEMFKGLLWAAGITGGFALMFIMGASLFDYSSPVDSRMGLPDSVLDAMQVERAEMMKMDALRSLLLVALSAGAIVLLYLGKIKKWLLMLFLGVLVTVDLVGVDTRYLSWDSFEARPKQIILPTEVDLEIMKDEELGYRVANFAKSTFNDATTSYFHRSIGGYHGAKLKRYQDLITQYLSRNHQESYNMLNTKYFIIADQKTGKLSYQINTDANGAGWFIEDIKWASNPQEEMAVLGSIDTKKSAVADIKFSDRAESPILGEGTVELMRYAPNRLVYQCDTPEGGVAVFSEIYYDKGWTAYIDGHQVDYFRANYTLRALSIPPGNHVVEFRFRAPNFKLLEGITLVFSIVILGGLLVYITLVLISLRKKTKKRNEQSAKL